MRTTLTTVTLALVAACLSTGSALAADPAPKDKPRQQSKMKHCNAEAKTQGLKGDERKAFMSGCLKAK